VDLIWVSRRVEDLSCDVKRVSDDNYVVGIGVGDCLIDTTSDSEKLSLCCGYVDSLM